MRIILLIIGVILSAGCQSRGIVPIPTLAQLPTITPTATVAPPTHTLTPVPPTLTETILPTETATITPTKGIVIRINITPSITPIPTATHTPLPEAFAFGRSADGRDLVAYRVGSGEHVVMLIGGIHTGYEANTVRLVRQLLEYFQANRREVLSDVTLLFIPLLNPDGYEEGRDIAGRYNGNGVDLNRNWDCGWSPEAYFREEQVDPGSAPFSEPETMALASLIYQMQPRAVIFYHAAANGIFAGDCEHGKHVSNSLATIYGQRSGYPFGDEFSEYPVSGTGPAWVDSLGIPSIDVELATADSTEFIRNLPAIIGIQTWLSNQR